MSVLIFQIGIDDGCIFVGSVYRFYYRYLCRLGTVMSRKCKDCRTEIPKVKDCKTFHEKRGYCSIDCAAVHSLKKVKDAAAKKERKDHKAAKERIKTRGDHAKDAQTEFNKFIRFRDAALTCVSCDRHHSGQYHAGHYRTVGANPELRFNELNCHKQCSVCNNHKSGNIVEYRINLAKRISPVNLDWLEGPHSAKKYTIEQLKEIKLKYRGKCKELSMN